MQQYKNVIFSWTILDGWVKFWQGTGRKLQYYFFGCDISCLTSWMEGSTVVVCAMQQKTLTLGHFYIRELSENRLDCSDVKKVISEWCVIRHPVTKEDDTLLNCVLIVPCSYPTVVRWGSRHISTKVVVNSKLSDSLMLQTFCLFYKYILSPFDWSVSSDDNLIACFCCASETSGVQPV